MVSVHAIEDVLIEHQPRLRALCTALAATPADADDLLQDTLLKALAKPPRDLDRPLWPWLRRVARNLATDRARKKREVLVEIDTVSEWFEPPDPDRARYLVAGLGLLNAPQRSVVLLRELCDLSGAETAEVTGHSEANVRVLHHRARKILEGTEPRPEHAAALVAALDEADAWCLADLLAVGATDPAATRTRLREDSRFSRRGARHAWIALSDALLALSLDGPHEVTVQALYRRAVAVADDERYDEGLADFDMARRIVEAEGIPGSKAMDVLHAQMAVYNRQFERAVDLVADRVTDTPRARSIVAATLWRQGRFSPATALLRQSLDLPATPAERALTVHGLGLLEAFRGETTAERRCREAWERLQAEGMRNRLAQTANALGAALQNAGRHDEAEEWFDRALALAGEFDQPGVAAYVWNNLALTRHEQGRYDQAEVLLLRTIRFRAADPARRRSWAIAVGNLGVLLHARGEPRRALRCFAEALQVERKPGDRAHHAFLWAHVAAARARAGRADVTEPLARAHAHLASVGDVRIGQVLEACTAVVDVLGGQPDRALARVDRLVNHGEPPPAATYLPLRIAVGLFSAAFDATVSSH